MVVSCWLLVVSTIKSYRDLSVWQGAMRLAELVYAAVRDFPRNEQFALSDQLRRAVVSIPSNIAEGFGRDTKSDFAHFLYMARGSVYEVETQLELASRLGYLADPQSLNTAISGLGKQLNALIAKVKSSTHR